MPHPASRRIYVGPCLEGPGEKLSRVRRTLPTLPADLKISHLKSMGSLVSGWLPGEIRGVEKFAFEQPQGLKSTGGGGGGGRSQI